MSRIDDALKRLTGGTPEPRHQQVLDRFASEGDVSKVEEPKRVPPRVEARKVTRLVVAAPPSSDERNGKTATEPAAQPWQEQRPAARPERPADSDAEVDKLIDVRQVADYVGFVLRSVVRHKLLAASTFAVVLVLAVTGALLVPKTYHIEVKLLAQRNAVMAAVSNPGRAVPWDADAPTRAAAETVLRRDNLISLITQTDLINQWDQRRAPIVKFKDWLRQVVTRHELTADEKLDALVTRLERYMIVSAAPVGDGTVGIDLYWPDAETGYQIVERARQAYLEARQVAETSAISESIAILERYSNSLHQDVNKTLTELQAAQAREKGGVSRTVARTPRRVTPAAPAGADTTAALPVTQDDTVLPDPELLRIKGLLAQRRDELARLEGERNKSLAELQAKLSALLTVYTATHPSVVTVQQQIAASKTESSQIAALKTSVDELETKYDELSAKEAQRHAQADVGRPSAAVTPRFDIPRGGPVEAEEEPTATATQPTQVTQFASLRLRTELSQLQNILERTDGARIELAVSEAAFKYRYTVIRPAQVPRDPESPNLRMFFALGFIASVLCGLTAALGADLISNRILEAWQVERQLGLPILGSVKIG
jgi:uncharacterized protein involved in exopolysaccharide biosynthesis